MSKTEGDCGGGSAANAGGGGGATDEVEVGGSISRAIISPFLSSSLYYAANKETGDFLRSAAPPPKKKGWGLPVTRRARRGRRKEVAQKHFHFQFQRTSNEQMISGKGESANFLEDVCPHIHIHVIRPSFPASVVERCRLRFPFRFPCVSPSADRELLHPQVRESD